MNISKSGNYTNLCTGSRTGRLWVYVRDDRNAGSTLPAAVWFSYSPDRKGIHPQQHLADYSGILQADAYAGYNALCKLNGIEPEAWLRHVISVINTWSANRVKELLPWNVTLPVN